MKIFPRITLIFSLFVLHAFVLAQNPVTIGINLRNKLEVALAVGPTAVDYSVFEDSLRARLSRKTPPVLPNYLIVSATRASSISSKSEFAWWVYDHTIQDPNASPSLRYKPKRTDNDGQNRPFFSNTINAFYKSYADFYNYLIAQANLGDAKTWNTATAPSVEELKPFRGITAPYGKIDDAAHTYIEYTVSTTGLDVTGGGDVANNQDMTSPNYNTTKNPYEALLSHVVESDNGATMDFYGYTQYSYKDFRYLPNVQKTKKTFEFAIEEDAAYDALDGVGFFFNTDITGSYAAKTQTMSGYLLFFRYHGEGEGTTVQGKAMYMAIYKFKDVNTYQFHHGLALPKQNYKDPGKLIEYEENGVLKFEEVARSTVYSETDRYRKIKVDVSPTFVRVYYNGSVGDPTVLTTPISETATPVNFEEGEQTGTQIELDETYISSYGFGPMASYLGHSCARPTHLTLQNLTMTIETARSLTEVVREPNWAENTKKFLVNVNEDPIEDFLDPDVVSELLARLRNDDIYYVGWCSNENTVKSSEFLVKYDLKGEIVNTQADTTQLLEEQLQKITDEVYERYWLANVNDTVLVTDNVVLEINGAEQSNSADPAYPQGKWKIVHHIEGFDDNDGLYPLSDVTVSDFDPQFNRSGEYEIYYCEEELKSIVAHKAPVASFNITLSGDVPTFIDDSYDPDDRSPAGIVSSEWSYVTAAAGAVPINHLTLEQLQEQLAHLTDGEIYVVTLKVTDKYGATHETSRQVSYVSNPEEDAKPPFPDFDITPKTILKGINTNIVLTDRSYDLQGLSITSAFTLSKNGEPVNDFTFAAGNNDISSLDIGEYVINIVTTNSEGAASTVFVTRTFSIVEDDEAPTVTATPEDGTFSENVQVMLNFSDAGGSGFKEQRFIVTNSTVTPDADDPAWTLWSSSPNRTANISKVGENYIHWEAKDQVDNAGSGLFGAYTLDKQKTSVTLTATPKDSVSYPNMITLHATFQNNTYPTGTVYFYLQDQFIGSANVTLESATFHTQHTPTALGENVVFSVSYSGDYTYDTASAEMTYSITKGIPNVVVNASGKIYDGEAYTLTQISVTGATTYDSLFTGRENTTYNSVHPPMVPGQYTITVTTTDPLYRETVEAQDFEITKRPLTITAIDETITYGETPDLEYTITNGSLLNGDVLSGDIALEASAIETETSLAAVGEHVITQGTLSAGENYDITFIDGTLTVNKIIPTTLTFPTASAIVYGDTLYKSELTGGTGDGMFAWTTSDTLPHVNNNGFEMRFTPDDTEHYDYSGMTLTQVVSVTVTPRPLGITAVDETITYGETPELEYTITNGNLLNGDVLSGDIALEASAIETETSLAAVGEHVITQGTLSAGENYDITFIDGTLTVNKIIPTTLTFPTASAIVYGDTLYKSVLTGGTGDGTFAWTTADSIPHVNNNGFEVRFTPNDAEHYDYSGMTLTQVVSVTVTPRPLGITAIDETITYGETPDLEYTITNGSLLNGDVLSGDIALEASAFETETSLAAVGEHVITQGTLSAGENYDLTFIDGQLTVNKIIPTALTFPTATAIVYGDTLYKSALTGGTGDGMFAWTTADTLPHVSNNGFEMRFTPDDAEHYDYSGMALTQVVSVTVTPRPLGITAVDETITYGETPDLEYTITNGNLLNGDVLSGDIALEASAFETETSLAAVGEHVITQGTLTAGENYDITFIDGTLTVNKIIPTAFTFPTASAIVYGDTLYKSALTGGTGDGTFAWTTADSIPHVNNNGFEVRFTPNDTEHYDYSGMTLTQVVSVTVTPRPLGITAVDETITYGETPDLEYTITNGNLVHGDTLKGALTVDNLNVGKHTITRGTLTAGEDYDITFTEGTLTVDAKTLDINLEIIDILVDGKSIQRDGHIFHTVVECGVDQTQISVIADLDATVRINGREENPQTLDLTNYGDNIIYITVASPDSSQTDTLVVTRYYDQIVYEYPDIPTINCNPQTNGGYTFSAFQWYREGIAVFAAEKSYLRINDNAVYHCEITDNEGKTWRTCHIRREEILADQRLTAYPNPTRGEVTVFRDKQAFTGTIQVFDRQGRLVLQPRQNQFDMSAFPAGVYMIKGNGETVKIIVEK